MHQPRQSNIELLRIVATLMILMVHFSGWLLSFANVHSYWVGGNGMAITRAALNSISYIGVTLFILISGYFSIHPKIHSLLNLFTCLVFFYVGMYVFNCYLTGEMVFQHHRVLRRFLAFSFENWFIQCYLFLMLLSPILNKFVEHVSEKYLLMYILVFVLCAFYFGCVHDSTFFYFNRGYSVTTFVMIYLIGRYLKLYGQERWAKIATWKIALLWTLFVIMRCAGELFASNYSILWAYHSPINLITATLFFILFTRIEITSKFINWLGVSCLAVYVFHTREPVMAWMIQADEELLNTNNPILYAGGAFVIITVVFIVAVLLDKMRIMICTPLLDIVDKIIKKGRERCCH